MSGSEVVYTDMFGLTYTQEELDAEMESCDIHERWLPCRVCLREEGFYDK